MAEFLHTALLNISVLLHIPFIKAEQKIYTFKKPSAHFGNINLTQDKQKLLQSAKTYIRHVFVAIALPLPDMWTSIRKNTLSICVKFATKDCSQKRWIYQQCSQTGKCSPSLYINCARKALYCKFSKHACDCKRSLQILAWKISSLK